MSSPYTFSFNGMMHFVVSPDRYFRIELRDGKLYFLKTGSQFDLAHPGSLGRNQMTGASANTTNVRKPPPRGVLILAGLGIIVVSIVVFAILVRFRIVRLEFVAFLGLGFLVLIAGLVTPRRAQAAEDGNADAAIAAHPHNFMIPTSEIDGITLILPKRPTQAAHLHIRCVSGKTLKLLIKSQSDLAIVRSSLLPLLGEKVAIA